jgi:hypothetical protein
MSHLRTQYMPMHHCELDINASCILEICKKEESDLVTKFKMRNDILAVLHMLID